MIGQTLDGRYRIVRSLGVGGFGHTYIAEDTRRPGNPSCVVKVLQPASNNPEFLEVARRLFRSEADTLEQLGHHDQIPRLLAFFEQDQDFCLVQELIDGAPLTDELIPGEPWPESRVKSLLSEVLEILVFIHDQGVIHRDIKPENIIRRRADQKLILVDFGSVKQVRNQALVTNPSTKFTVVVGTPGYMASEQSQGKPRPNSDLYSLGVIAIQALTGRPPSQFQEDGDGELVWREQATVSDDFAQVLTQMVRPYFKLRYQTAMDAWQALRQISPAFPSPSIPPASPSVPSTAASATLPIEPTQVATPTPVLRPPQRPSAPVAKSAGCAPWILGFGTMAMVMGLGVVGLAYWGEIDELFPFLQPKVATVDNGANLLEQARQEARQSGNLEAAIAIATQIPSNSDSAADAQVQVQDWQTQWQQQQDLFNRAKTAFDAQRWYIARDLAFKLPQNPYWDKRADSIYFTAKRKIAELERPTPTPSEPPEPTLAPSPDSPEPEQPISEPSPDPTQPEDSSPSPSPDIAPLQLPTEIPVPPPTPNEETQLDL